MFNLSLEELYSNLNVCKELTLDALLVEGYISQEVHDEFLQFYGIVVHKRNWFGRMFYKLNIFKNDKGDENCFSINVVKFVKGLKNKGEVYCIKVVN